MSDLFNSFIQNRRPYFNRMEQQRAALFLEQQARSCGYICIIDAAMEQLNIWFPNIIKKRPIEDYGIQLELDLPNWDKKAHLPTCSVPTGEEKEDVWNDYYEEEELVEEWEEYDLPF